MEEEKFSFDKNTVLQILKDDAFINRRLIDFFNVDYESQQIERRFNMFKKRLSQDRDRVRLHGQYYNNIYLGKRIFGPARKQVFSHSIVGGMERRFEIIDNQVNHIPMVHEASDKYKEKCRNPKVKCRDDTRVILHYPEDDIHNFIHANRVASPILFNDFILTQAPMENTIADFWRMVWQEEPRYIFMLINRDDPRRCASYWPTERGTGIKCCELEIVNDGVDYTRDPLFKVTTLVITGPGGKELTLEHWQGDMNNSADLQAPLRLLQLSRNCDSSTIVHDHLGVSRAAVLVAIELTICNLLRGPTFKFSVQQSVHYLRSFRAFAIETPMQYIYIHRVVLYFIRPFVGDPDDFQIDYERWMKEREHRLFVSDSTSLAPAHCLLSPMVDPDLLAMVRRKDRPEFRREIHAHVGELPLSLQDPGDLKEANALPLKYPKGTGAGVARCGLVERLLRTNKLVRAEEARPGKKERSGLRGLSSFSLLCAAERSTVNPIAEKPAGEWSNGGSRSNGPCSSYCTIDSYRRGVSGSMGRKLCGAKCAADRRSYCRMLNKGSQKFLTLLGLEQLSLHLQGTGPCAKFNEAVKESLRHARDWKQDERCELCSGSRVEATAERASVSCEPPISHPSEPEVQDGAAPDQTLFNFDTLPTSASDALSACCANLGSLAPFFNPYFAMPNAMFPLWPVPGSLNNTYTAPVEHLYPGSAQGSPVDNDAMQRYLTEWQNQMLNMNMMSFFLRAPSSMCMNLSVLGTPQQLLQQFQQQTAAVKPFVLKDPPKKNNAAFKLRWKSDSNMVTEVPPDGDETPLDLSAKKPGQLKLDDEESGSRASMDLNDKSSSPELGEATAKLSKRNYTEQALNSAVQDIIDGRLGTRRASVVYGIPRSTLRNKIYKLESVEDYNGLAKRKKKKSDELPFDLKSAVCKKEPEASEPSPLHKSQSVPTTIESPSVLPFPTLPTTDLLSTLTNNLHLNNTLNPFTDFLKQYVDKRVPDGGRSKDSKENSTSPATENSSDEMEKRPRPKRGQYRRYDKGALERAVLSVRKGEMSVHRAGSFYGVPHSTLEYKVKERNLLRGKRRSGDKALDSASAPAAVTATRSNDEDAMPTSSSEGDKTSLDDGASASS